MESGFEFFVEEGYPAFSRLLHALRVPLRRYPMTFTLYFENSRTAYLLPPKRPGHFFWPVLAPRSLAYLLQFDFLLRRASRLVERRNAAITIGDFVARFPFLPSFCAEFLYPLMNGGWCFPIDEFRRMSAYNVLKYFVLMRPNGLEPRGFCEIVGGTAAYVAALRDAMPRVTIQCGSKVQCIRRRSGAFVVESATGEAGGFDHLVFASNALDACRLLYAVDGAEEVRAVLGQFRYLRTSIAVHGDRRLMPAEENIGPSSMSGGQGSAALVPSGDSSGHPSPYLGAGSRPPNRCRSRSTISPITTIQRWISTTFGHSGSSLRYRGEAICGLQASTHMMSTLTKVPSNLQLTSCGSLLRHQKIGAAVEGFLPALPYRAYKAQMI